MLGNNCPEIDTGVPAKSHGKKKSKKYTKDNQNYNRYKQISNYFTWIIIAYYRQVFSLFH